MRVTSDFWASALIRRIFSDGGFAAVLDRGATEAGAIFVVQRGRDGSQRLYGPAAQAIYQSGKPDDRSFTLIAESDDPTIIDQRITKERRFDPDLWLIEIEADPVRLPTYIDIVD